MRIISGEYRSRLISMPKDVKTRPTQDKVREAVFNLIGDCRGKRALDIFAGSGAFGIEAISRGASHATFVDNSYRCISAIKLNMESLGVNDTKYNIIKGNGLSIAGRLSKANEKYDFIFLDPPYYKDMARICLINVSNYDILSPNGLVIVERFTRDGLAVDLKDLLLKKERRYGDTAISIFGRLM